MQPSDSASGLKSRVGSLLVLGVFATWGGLKLGQLIVLARHPLAGNRAGGTRD